MNTLFAFPGAGQFACEVAHALLESDCLAGFATTFAYRDGSGLARCINLLPSPLKERALQEFSRRELANIPSEKVETQPFWEIVRTAAAKLGTSRVLVDRIWDHQSHVFARAIAKRLERGDCRAIYGYEYTAKEPFETAQRLGIARILDLPSLSSRAYRDLEQRELSSYAELRDPNQEYFCRRFADRQRRRDQEIAIADIIVTNSQLTARSHIEHGVDPSKVITVPLAAPPTIRNITHDIDNDRPLRFVWAGSFQIRKGAHYFLEAWRGLAQSGAARCEIYGAFGMPERLLGAIPPGLEFRGAINQKELFQVFQSSDALVFPTLSDGFGLVISEALAHALPVITTKEAGAADLVQHKANGLIVPAGDARALQDALQWCLDNRQALREMREQAVRSARLWQWPDYRRTLIERLTVALRRAGYEPTFGNPGAKPVLSSTCG